MTGKPIAPNVTPSISTTEEPDVVRVRREPLAGREESGVRERHRRRVDRLPERRPTGRRPRCSMRGKSSAATTASITSTLTATVASRLPVSPSRMAWPSAIGPLRMRSGFASPAASSFCRSPSRRLMMRPRIEARVSTPMPPISTPTKTKTWPNGDQKVAMSTVESPVTQITETAVKRASTNGACSPEVVAIGSENSTVKTPTRPREDEDGEAGRRCGRRSRRSHPGCGPAATRAAPAWCASVLPSRESW